MADAPWRCSQCGTVNEPVANACRTCGRWPSLFDLEGNTIESDSYEADDDLLAPEPVEADQFEPGMVDDIEPVAPSADVDADEPHRPSRRRLVRMIVPIAFVIYLVVRSLVDR